MLKPLSITEISKYITQIFDMEEMLQGVKIYGEVSGCSYVRGNLYFSLKDENSILSCIMFGVSGNNIKDGDAIMATGSLKYYAKGGKLNFYVSSFAPKKLALTLLRNTKSWKRKVCFQVNTKNLFQSK